MKDEKLDELKSLQSSPSIIRVVLMRVRRYYNRAESRGSIVNIRNTYFFKRLLEIISIRW